MLLQAPKALYTVWLKDTTYFVILLLQIFWFLQNPTITVGMCFSWRALRMSELVQLNTPIKKIILPNMYINSASSLNNNKMTGI